MAEKFVEKAKYRTPGQIDVLEGGPDSVSQETESLVRSTKKERMITRKEARALHMRNLRLREETREMLAKKVEKDKHPNLDL
ncbi:MAG: hypothetical protein Q7R73_04330 [bacterium]|nr:hypothetical protein [bacterium]